MLLLVVDGEMNKGFFNNKKDVNVPSVNVDELAARMECL